MPSELSSKPTRITFAVDAVTPAAEPVWTETLAASLDRRFRRRTLVLPGSQKQVINAKLDSIWQQQWAQNHPYMPGSRCHPLIDAVHVAFSQHRPLTLSPDSIWLVIAQGFGHHVAENAEKLRRRLVRHEGQRVLTTHCHSLDPGAFEKAIADFSAQIREATDPVLHETLVCDFSTTTAAARTASQVALMDTFASYFQYTIKCVCGIPKITIEGTTEDWRRIRARVEVLATYDLEWWVARLRPILDEFVLAAEGNSTPEFWQAIYKPLKAYAIEAATGWITDLFPYLGDAPDRRRNHVFEHPRSEWMMPGYSEAESRQRFSPVAYKGVSPSSFPSGLSSVPVKLKYKIMPDRDVDLVAGFLGVEQNPADLSLAPVIGWCVTEPRPAQPVLVGYTTRSELQAEAELDDAPGIGGEDLAGIAHVHVIHG